MQTSEVEPTAVQTVPKDAGVQVDRASDDIQTMSVAFSEYCRHVLNLDVKNDFLEVSSSAMVRLKVGGRSNVVYNLAKGIGTSRKDEAESRFPVNRMPMGLVEYRTNFFIAENINMVGRLMHNFIACKQ